MRVLKKIFSLFQDNREILNLSAFGNEIAFKTSWEPLVGGGTNFCTHRAQKNTDLMGDVVVFKTAIQADLFAISFVALGAMFAIASAAGEFEEEIGLMGLGFLAFGCWIWRFFDLNIEFNIKNCALQRGSFKN